MRVDSDGQCRAVRGGSTIRPRPVALGSDAIANQLGRSSLGRETALMCSRPPATCPVRALRVWLAIDSAAVGLDGLLWA
jgi:hypothetical protein